MFIISFVDPGGPLKVLAKKMVNQRVKDGATAKDLFYHLVRSLFFLCDAIYFIYYPIYTEWRGRKRTSNERHPVNRRGFRCHSCRVMMLICISTRRIQLCFFDRSDTTSTALASLWAYLLQNPQCYARLKAEVDTTFPAGEDPFNQTKLSTMTYLNACLYVVRLNWDTESLIDIAFTRNETMRLTPPVPGGSQRTVPAGSGGRMLGPQ